MAKVTQGYGSRIKTPEVEYNLSDRRLMGIAMIEQLKIKNAKRAKEFIETGCFSKPLSKSVLNLIRERTKVLAGYCESRLSSPRKRGGKFTSISYEEMSLLGFVPDIDRRNKALQKIINHAEETSNKKMLAAAIRIGLVYHIPGPLEPYTEHMKAEDHLQFLKDSIAATGLKEMRPHFELVKAKAELRKSPKAASVLYEQLSLLETAAASKKDLFNKSLEKADLIKTAEVRNQRYKDLSRTVSANESKNNPYEIFREDKRFKDFSERETQSRYQKPLEKMMNLPIDEFKFQIGQYKSPAYRAELFRTYSVKQPELRERMFFFREAMRETLSLKTPKAKGKMLLALRGSAPTEKYLNRTHEIFTENALFTDLMDDTLRMKQDERRNLYFIKHSLKEIAVQKEDTLSNQKYYAPHATELRELSLGIVMADEYRP
jgi:hypothetical protein